MGSMSKDNEEKAQRVAEAINTGFEVWGIAAKAVPDDMWNVAIYFGEDPRNSPISKIKLPTTTDETGLVTVHI